MSFDFKKQEILDKISIVELISEYVPLKQKGDKYWGLCPFHNEKTPSFSVTEEKNMFYCFGCHKGGNSFDFLIEMENLSFFEAFKRLGEKAGVEVISRTESPEDKLKVALFELNNRITGSFNYILQNKTTSNFVRKYLLKRKIDSETVNKFKLGYAPAERFWLYNFLKSKNYSDSFLEKSGIFSKKNNKISLFTNRIVFPIINVQQDTIAFSARKLKESDWGGKYINSPETSVYKKGESLFGIHIALEEIRKTKEFFLVEGNFDVLAFYQAGIKNVVAPLGTAFTELQAKFMKRYATKCIIAFDSDSAGVNATIKSSIILEKLGMKNMVIAMPEGKDPSEILEKEGSEALNKLSKYPINTFEYIVTKAVNRYGLLNSEKKELILKFIAPYLGSLETELKKMDCFRYLSDILELSVEDLVKDFAVLTREKRIKKVTNRRGEEHNKIKITLDLYLMMALVENREAFRFVRNAIDLDDIVDSRAKKVYILLEEMYRKGDFLNKNLLSEIDDEELRELLAYKLSIGEYKLNSKQLIQDGVNKIKERNFKNQRREVELLIRKKDYSNNRIELERLLTEKKYLDEELIRIKGNQ